MDSHIVLFGLFAVVAFVIVTDENVAAAFVYVFKLANTEIKRHWWWLTNNPKNPVVKYMISVSYTHLTLPTKRIV